MADFTITITNSINSFGPAPSTKWGLSDAMEWGVSKWGEGTLDLVSSFIKVLQNSIGSDSSLIIATGYNRTMSNTLSLTEDLSFEGLSDSNGYSRLFSGSATNAESRIISTYSTAAAGTSTYSSLSAGSTVWS